jgi:RNA polymerase sigma-70 factor (ECF subfamily)
VSRLSRQAKARAFERARHEWPEIALSFAAFDAALARHGIDKPSELEGLHVADLFLATACHHGDPAALVAFDRLYATSIAGVASRSRGRSDFEDEVHQRLRIRLLVGEGGAPPRIASYTGRGSLRGWVQVSAARIAINLARGDRAREGRREQTAATLDLRMADELDPEANYLRGVHRETFQQAFQDALEGLSPRQRNVLRLRFLDGVNIDGIGAVYRVHRTTAARWVREARTQVMNHTRRLLGARLRLSPRTVDSLVRLLESELELRDSLLLSMGS